MSEYKALVGKVVWNLRVGNGEIIKATTGSYLWNINYENEKEALAVKEAFELFTRVKGVNPNRYIGSIMLERMIIPADDILIQDVEVKK